jgi:hypothetical protein
MNNLRKITANAVGVIPAYVSGNEKHGFCYFMWETANAVGAQCANCHTIVWQNPFNNEILSEDTPSGVPDSGKQYVEYYLQKVRRFLTSQPKCPECGSNHFDLFVNNVNFPRYSDGTTFDEDQDLTLEEHPNAQIWWLE